MGFKKGEGVRNSCSLTSIAQTRIKKRQSTFIGFVDFSKAYDRIDRNSLWTKLSNLGMTGNILNAIGQLYSHVECAVRVNGHVTPWFKVDSGVKQGFIMSPLLFNSFVNDLIETQSPAMV